MTTGDRRLQRIGAEAASKLLSALQRGKAMANKHMIPACAVLIEEQDRLSGRADPRANSRSLNFHECYEAVHLRLVRNEACQDTPETQRVFAQRRAHPVFAGSGRVAFVEDEIDHLKHGR